jgi:ectoine hydroxylase
MPRDLKGFDGTLMKQRDDPTVWSPIIPRDLISYDENGYQKRKSFYDPQQIKLVREDAYALREERVGKRLVFEKDGITIRGIYDVLDVRPSLRDILITSEVVELAETILGSEVYLHQSVLHYKSAWYGGGFFWHSDFMVWHWEDGLAKPRMFLVMIPLDEISLENGPLVVVPGSHKYYDEFLQTEVEKYKEYGRSVSGMENCTQDQLKMLDMLSTDMLTGKPGDIFCLDSNMLHASNPNLSSQDRPAIFLIFNSMDNKPQSPFNGKPPRGEWVSGRSYEPLRKVQ